MTVAAVSEAGLALIQDYEGFCAQPTQLPDGAWLVGYGHVAARAGEPVDEAEAINLLRHDLAPFEGLVSATVVTPLTQSQFDALVSFAFSIGARAFEQSQVLRRVNAGEFVAGACAMDAWRKSDAAGETEVFEALIVRRAAEKAMFLQDLPRRAAPSALMRAQLDHAASILGAPVRFAMAPKIASTPAAQAKPEATAPVGDSSDGQPSEPFLLTQVAASDVESELAGADAGRGLCHTIGFVELPIDRRIRDGRKGGLGIGLKSLWDALRTPKAERA